MPTLALWIWAGVATTATIVLRVLHFANPYPLVQIPDRGHRIYVVPDERSRDVMVEVFKMAGERPYGTFTAGVHQTLMRDGFTILAYGPDMQRAAISFPVANPVEAALSAYNYLMKHGVRANIIRMPGELHDKLVVVQTQFYWDIAYRLSGKDMPPPVWEHKY